MSLLNITLIAIIVIACVIYLFIRVIKSVDLDNPKDTLTLSYKVYYMPLISERTKTIIRKHIFPNMTSIETAIYSIDEIMVNIHDLISIEDLSLLAEIERKGNRFIEF